MKIAFLYKAVGISDKLIHDYEERLHAQIMQCKATTETLPEDCSRAIAKGADALVVFNRAFVRRLSRMSLPVPVVVGEPTIGSMLYSLLEIRRDLQKEKPLIAADCSVLYGFAGRKQQDTYRGMEEICGVRLVNIEREQLRNPSTRAAEMQRLRQLGADAVLIPASIGTNAVSGYGVPVYNNQNYYSEEANFLALTTAMAELQELNYRRREMTILRQLIEMSAQVSLCMNAEGEIMFASAKAQSVLNCSELAGKHLQEFLPEVQRPLQQIAKDGKNIDGVPITIADTVWQTNFSATRQDEEELLILCTLSMVKRIRRIEQADYQQLSSEGALAAWSFKDFVGHSAAFRAAMNKAEKFALCELPVWIEGEEGTGKKSFAQSIHNAGVRRLNAFVHLNCAASRENIADTLFGVGENNGQGRKPRKGCLERANGGTLFLENIEQLPMEDQARLQLSLERRCVRRIGDTVLHPIDVRVIVSSSDPAAQLAQEGQMLPALVYQLKILCLRLPALQERKEDILPLFELYFRRACEMQSRVIKAQEKAVKQIENYAWPGNIRELIGFCQRLSILAEGGEADAEIVKECLGESAAETPGGGVGSLQTNEEKMIRDALQKFGGSKARAAEALGISTTTLWRKCRAMGI